MMTDTIADSLTRLRNAIMADKDQVVIPHSKAREAVFNLLHKTGYLTAVEVLTDEKNPARKNILATIRYEKTGVARLKHIRRVSRPGLRVYTKTPEKLSVRTGLGMHIISTSKGLLTDRDAMEQKLGGEIVAELW